MLPAAPHGLADLRIYGTGFAGREAELAALDRAWTEGVRVFVLHAQGGAGKTRVVARWLTQLGDDGWRGAGGVFVHSFYSQGSDERRNASSDTFFAEALAYFGHAGPPLTDPSEKGRALARLVAGRRGLLVLDGLEPLQQPPSFDQGRLKDPAVQSLLLALAAGWLGEAPPLGGLCLVTSRQTVVELVSMVGRVVVQQPLDRLDAEAGAELLRQLEVAGPEKGLRQASEELHGHAYALMLLGSYLRDATPDHEIWRRTEIPLLQEDAEHNHHARHLFAAYVRHLGELSPEVAVLRLLGFFDRPAEETLLTALRQADEDDLAPLTAPLRDLTEPSWRRLLRRLSDLRLIDLPAGPSPALDAHPLLRESFAEQVQTHFRAAWKAGHRRLFYVLCTTTEHRPDTLPGLQPLYQAVAHGCLAELHEQACADVYRDRILRGEGSDGFYSSKKLGAIAANLGAVACFFETHWTKLASNLAPADQAWLYGEAAHCLLTLGRLAEAAEPIRWGWAMAAEQGDWHNAAIRAGTFSELKLTRGEVAAAVASAEQAVAYADRCRDSFQKIFSLTTQADALHQAGWRAESRRLFKDAESQQAKQQPELSRLYSQGGFRYCDLLLAEAERAAWQRWLRGGPGNGDMLPVDVLACAVVSNRATYALKIAEDNRWRLQIALGHLTLARATLYKADFTIPIPAPVLQHVAAAVDGLRASGTVHELPRGLLTRSWLLCLSGDEAGGRTDLEEAWEIAERGPMKLFQADIHLTHARLFRDREALAEARRLIAQYGYHRRDEELTDAEGAAQLWDFISPRPSLPSPLLPPKEGAPPAAREEYSLRDQVFISFSHRDNEFMEEFLIHLKPYLRSGSVTYWADQQIASGSQWFREIQAALARTRVAVLLVSSDFLASDFIHEHELGPLLAKAKAGDVRILWVPLRPSAYEETDLKELQAVSSPAKPLAQMSKADRDEAWVRICKEIKAMVSG